MFNSDKKKYFKGKIALRIRLDEERFALPISEPQKLNGAIEILSHKCAIVPRYILKSKSPAEILSDCGISLSTREMAIRVDHGGENILVTAIYRERLREMREMFGEQIIFTSPMMRRPVNSSQHIIIHRNLGLTYINVYNSSQLLCSEVFQTPTPTDSLYWLSRIYDALEMDNTALFVSNSDRELVQLLRNHYKYVGSCE